MQALNSIIFALSIIFILLALFIEISGFLTFGLVMFVYASISMAKPISNYSIPLAIIFYIGWRFYINSICKKRKLKSKNKEYQKLVDEAMQIKIASNSRRAAAVLERLK